jgi:hypothetical protein
MDLMHDLQECASEIHEVSTKRTAFFDEQADYAWFQSVSRKHFTRGSQLSPSMKRRKLKFQAIHLIGWE